MKSKTALLLSCFLILTSIFSQAFAQDLSVSGKVTNKSNGEALPGATITVKGTSTGTKSDANGNFTVNAQTGAVLKISYIGMIEQEVSITSSTTQLSVELEPLANSMNEIVVVGYGTQKRSVVTGAISSIKAKDLENVPSNRVEQSLQGRVSGVTIAQNSGQPGSPSTVRVRGLTTFGDGGNNPLWVVDGVHIGYMNKCR